MTVTFRIVVATYKRPDDLGRFLEAILPELEAAQDCELVIVNDASHSPEYDAVLCANPGRYEYRVLEKNLGPSGARKAGLADATADYLICTDDDCVPTPYWLPWIRAYVTAHPSVDLIAGRTVSAIGKDAGSWQKLLDLRFTYPAPHSSSAGLVTAVTACSVMRRDAYVAVGGFPDDKRGAAEDSFLTQELLRGGCSYIVPPAVCTLHKANSSLREVRRRFRNYGAGGIDTVYAQQNWVLAETGADGRFFNGVKSARNKVRRLYAEQVPIGQSRMKRLVSWLILWFICLEYEWGWYTAFRAHRRRGLGPMPKRPEGFVRF